MSAVGFKVQMNPALSSSIMWEDGLKLILKSEWPHFSKQGIGSGTYWLPEYQSDFTDEHPNVHPRKLVYPCLVLLVGNEKLLPRPVPRSGVQLCSKAEECPCLLPKASSSCECQKPWLYPTPSCRFMAPSWCCCEQAVFSVWQTGTFWRHELRNISFWKLWHICCSFCISQTFTLVFSCRNLATEYMGPWL